MNTNDVITERELVFVSPSGEEILTKIQLGKPYSTESDVHRCDFEIPQIEKKRFAEGIDGIQAILLSMCMIALLLDAKQKKGWKFLWPDTRETTSPRELFCAEQFAQIAQDI